MTANLLVIDMNHSDASREVGGHVEDLVDFGKAYKFGIRGIIHKATEGEHFMDPLYHSRRQKAVAAGMLWGAYHFMRPGDVGNQVSFFLRAVGPSSQPPFTKYCLDYEDDKLALWQAQRWLELIHMATAQVPWLYSGFLIREQAKSQDVPSLAQYPLWLAEYSETAKIPRPWTSYVLWQRSGDGEGPGPHDIPGIGTKQDINYFDGNESELRTAWTA